MKITAEQKTWLRNYLSENLKYSETCAEFYDHILTGLEHYEAQVSFFDAVDAIIIRDFGSIWGMIANESRYHDHTIAEIKKKYWHTIKDTTRVPSIIMFMASAAVVFYAVNQPWFNNSIFALLLFTIALIPSVLNGIRYIKTGFVFKDTKKSVKDEAFIWMKNAPAVFSVLVLFLVWLFKIPMNTEPVKQPIIITIILLAYAIHTLSFYKTYKKQNKISIG
jgi:hypothetical protein